jgi:hypothetical protein
MCSGDGKAWEQKSMGDGERRHVELIAWHGVAKIEGLKNEEKGKWFRAQSTRAHTQQMKEQRNSAQRTRVNVRVGFCEVKQRKKAWRRMVEVARKRCLPFNAYSFFLSFFLSSSSSSFLFFSFLFPFDTFFQLRI